MNQPTNPALDWPAIRQQYPKAFSAMQAWMTNYYDQSALFAQRTRVDLERCYIPANPRDLYDFFDGQGVRVFPGSTGEAYKWRICDNQDATIAWAWDGFDTRPAAETAGFAAAFGVLEGMLNQKQG